MNAVSGWALGCGRLGIREFCVLPSDRQRCVSLALAGAADAADALHLVEGA
jgi:hypothetical protein